MYKLRTLCVMFLYSISVALGQDFQVHDVLVSSPDAQIIDTEFDIYQNRICWQSGDDHSLWVCRLDTVTWSLTVPDGKETLVDTALVPICETSNGGEWGYDMNGTYIFYNKRISKTNYIAVAAEYAPNWILTTFLDAPARINAHATQNPTDTVLGFQYIRTQSSDHTKYKFLDYPLWERQVLWFTDAHWARQEKILTGILCDGQVGMVDFNTCIFPQPLTEEPDFDFSVPFMWREPCKGYQRMFFARANDTLLRVYKESGPIIGKFSLYMSFSSPSSNPAYKMIASPEPIIFEGQSYISFMVSSSPYENAHVPSEIWIVKLDSLNPIFRMVSDTSLSIRTDPEMFATPDSLLVYYTEAIAPNTPEAKYLLRKCETGIGKELPTGAGNNNNKVHSPFRAFPNPFTDHFSVAPSKGAETFTLTGLSGVTLWQGKDPGKQDFTSLPKGFYLLHVTSDNNITTLKLVKE